MIANLNVSIKNAIADSTSGGARLAGDLDGGRYFSSKELSEQFLQLESKQKKPVRSN